MNFLKTVKIINKIKIKLEINDKKTDYVYVAPGFNRKQVVFANKKYLYIFDSQHSTVNIETTFL
ncbi:MAG: hypothetical protein IPJ32_17910 [Sphingobacteriaceae bacterium]|nr:hypothetical protein [Sphingobacteriaceae bacterium]